MQAKVTGMAINTAGVRTVTLSLITLDLHGKPRDPNSAFTERVTLREDELSLAGLALGDILNVEFTTAGATRADPLA